MRLISFLIAAAAMRAIGAESFAETDLIDSSWQHSAPREEIAPAFVFDGKGGRDGSAALVIQSDEREGLSGQWFKTVPVKGGQHYRFSVARQCDGVSAPRRETSVCILWQDDAGNQVPDDGPTVTSVLEGWKAKAEPEYPGDREIGAQGWAEVSGVYRAPGAATQARLELHLPWARRATVRWSHGFLEPCEKPAARTVRLAAAHYRPQSRSMKENRTEFAPLIAEAAKQRADLVVLPETLTYYGLHQTYADCSEPVPGPSTDYFGALAKEHHLYIVAGLHLTLPPAPKPAAVYRPLLIVDRLGMCPATVRCSGKTAS